MSITFGKGDLLFEQRLLACGGFYTDQLDGLWGKNSEAASRAATAAYEDLRGQFGAVDARSESNIATLLPAMQRKAREIMRIRPTQGFIVRVLSGTRTYAEQNGLFNQTPKVTNARGGQSNHNFGIAIDVGLFTPAGRYLTGANRAEERAYTDFAASVKSSVDGIEWGGDWHSFKDQPHYQLALQGSPSISRVRTLFEAGQLTRTGQTGV